MICEPNFISAMIATKIENLLHKKQNHQIILVQPKNVINEPKHLITYQTIWKFIDFFASICGISAYKKVEFNLSNFRVIVVTSMICLAFVSFSYTMVINLSNIPTLLEGLCLYGMLVPVRILYAGILFTP